MISNITKLTARPTDGNPLGSGVHESLEDCTDCKKWVKIELISAQVIDGKFHLNIEIKNQWFEKVIDMTIEDGARNELLVRTDGGGLAPSADFYRVETDINFAGTTPWTISFAIEKSGNRKGKWVFVKS